MRSKLLSLVVFVPENRAEELLEALFAAGAGAYGSYDRCAFCVKGEGRFRPLPGARPFLGESGVDEHVAEVRAEMIVADDKVDAVIAALRAVHPYEEPAFYLTKLDLPDSK